MNDDIHQSGVFAIPDDTNGLARIARSLSRMAFAGYGVPVLSTRSENVDLFDTVTVEPKPGWPNGVPVKLRFFGPRQNARRVERNVPRGGLMPGTYCMKVNRVALRASHGVCSLPFPLRGDLLLRVQKNDRDYWEWPVHRLVNCYDAAGLYEQACGAELMLQPEDRVRVRLDGWLEHSEPLSITVVLGGERSNIIDRV